MNGFKIVVAAAVAVVLASGQAASGALLTGSVTSPGAAYSVDLTAEGTLDWALWEGATTAKFDQKATPIDALGSLSLIGAPALYDYGGTWFATYNWTDGANAPSGTDDGLTQAHPAGVGTGFSLAAPADTTERNLKLYFGSYQATGQLTATLSDGSASPYVTSVTTDTTHVFDLNYQAASAGQTLTVDWVKTAGAGGNILVGAAALWAPPAPVAQVLDDFDDGNIATNTTGQGSGFTVVDPNSGTVGESGTVVTLNPIPGWQHWVEVISNDQVGAGGDNYLSLEVGVDSTTTSAGQYHAFGFCGSQTHDIVSPTDGGIQMNFYGVSPVGPPANGFDLLGFNVGDGAWNVQATGPAHNLDWAKDWTVLATFDDNGFDISWIQDDAVVGSSVGTWSGGFDYSALVGAGGGMYAFAGSRDTPWTDGDLIVDYISATGVMIPEPATMALLALGGVAVLLRRKRGRN